MIKVIDWNNFPDVPEGFSKLDLAEVKRVYDYELPPLVVYAGVAEDREGHVIPVVAVIEEGTEIAKLYILEKGEESVERELIASLV